MKITGTPAEHYTLHAILGGLMMQLEKCYKEKNSNKYSINRLASEQKKLKKEISLLQNSIHYVKSLKVKPNEIKKKISKKD